MHIEFLFDMHNKYVYMKLIHNTASYIHVYYIHKKIYEKNQSFWNLDEYIEMIFAFVAVHSTNDQIIYMLIENISNIYLGFFHIYIL